MAKNKNIVNRKAGLEYALDSDRIEAGIAFLGWEAKAVREGRADLNTAVVRILRGEAVLLNAKIFPENAPAAVIDRPRKLLLKKAEILALETKTKAKKLTLVPTRFYTKGRLIKLEIKLGKTRRDFEKREAIKKRDINNRLRQGYDG